MPSAVVRENGAPNATVTLLVEDELQIVLINDLRKEIQSLFTFKNFLSYLIITYFHCELNK